MFPPRARGPGGEPSQGRTLLLAGAGIWDSTQREGGLGRRYCVVSLHGHRWEASVVRRAGARHTGSTSLAGEGRAPLPVNKGCALEEGAQCEEWWEQL